MDQPAGESADSEGVSKLPGPRRNEFKWARHSKYFQRCLGVMPSSVAAMESQRMTLVFFSVSGLDLLGALDAYPHKADAVQWIYSLQVLPRHTVPAAASGDSKNSSSIAGDLDTGMRHAGGFRGNPANGHKFCSPFSDREESLSEPAPSKETAAPPVGPMAAAFDCSHLAMTYTALTSLLVLGDDLGGVDRAGALDIVGRTQKADGSFTPTTLHGEDSDMRFSYCAACVCYILGETRPTGNEKAAGNASSAPVLSEGWSAAPLVDGKKATEFILSCQTYEGGFAQAPGLEAHGGSTFCAVATLWLTGSLGRLTDRRRADLVRWCLHRQTGCGYQGRVNKPEDTCYSFWVGAALRLLDVDALVSAEPTRAYLLETECGEVGGFSKWPSYPPDPFHSYTGVAGLALMGEDAVGALHPALNISMRAARWLDELVARREEGR